MLKSYLSHCYSVADSCMNRINNSNDHDVVNDEDADDDVNSNYYHLLGKSDKKKKNTLSDVLHLMFLFSQHFCKGDYFKDPYITDEDTGARIG